MDVGLAFADVRVSMGMELPMGRQGLLLSSEGTPSERAQEVYSLFYYDVVASNRSFNPAIYCLARIRDAESIEQ